MRQKLPVIHLVESAGANLLKYKVELWSRFGNVFRDLARLSARVFPPWWFSTAARRQAALTCPACRTMSLVSKKTAWQHWWRGLGEGRHG